MSANSMTCSAMVSQVSEPGLACVPRIPTARIQMYEGASFSTNARASFERAGERENSFRKRSSISLSLMSPGIQGGLDQEQHAVPDGRATDRRRIGRGNVGVILALHGISLT